MKFLFEKAEEPKEGSLFIEGETGQEYVLPLRNGKSRLTLYQILKRMGFTDEQIEIAWKKVEEDDSIRG